ncbi:MAG: DUF6588 family protein [Salinivenus sp.]
MHARLAFALASLLLFALLPPPAQAQRANWVGEQYADQYAQPITDALGANLNAGLFRPMEVGSRGPIPTMNVSVGVTAMGGFTGGSETAFPLDQDRVQTDDGRTLTITYPDGTLPTAFGEETSPGTMVISDGDPATPDETLKLPPGLWNTSIAPLALVHLGAGTVFGTDAQVRFVPKTDIRDYGSVSLFGLSVRHSLSQYVARAPVDVAVQGAWHTVSFTGGAEAPALDVDASGWAVNAQVSKGLRTLPVTVYGGLQYEQFGLDAGYEFRTISGTSTVAFAQDAATTVRAVAGISSRLSVLQLNLDYSLGANNALSAGVGLTL